MLATVEISSDILNAIFSAANAELMDIDEVLINIKDGKCICYQRNYEGSGMFMFESDVQDNLRDLDVQLPIYKKDIKTILSLIKKDKAMLDIRQGETVFTFGKIVKKFPQPSEVKVPSKIPSLETTTTVVFSAESVIMLDDSFSDIKGGDIKINSSEEGIEFVAVGEVRSTSLKMSKDDVVSFNNSGKSMSGYDKKMLTSMFYAKKGVGTFKLEMGDDTALKFTHTIPNVGVTTFFIAQKIYD